VSATTVQLLQAASEIAGGTVALAERLGIGETLLIRFITGCRELPDGLLLKAVDIILADRHSRWPDPDGQPGRPVGLSPAPEIPENGARGNGATFESGGGR
jgi:hypothetical protein